MLKLSCYQMISLVPHPISIDAKPPFWFQGAHLKELAPNINLVQLWKKGVISFDEYKFRYNFDVLRNLDPWDILKKIKSNAGNDLDKCALLSYDSPNVISYRHFVGEWLNRSTGLQVKELALSDIDKSPKVKWIDPLTVIGNINQNYLFNTIDEIPIDHIKEKICISTKEIKNIPA